MSNDQAVPANDPIAKLSPRLQRVVRFVDRLSYELLVLVLVGLFVLIALFGQIVHNIPTGHVGVYWSRFGGGTRVDTYMAEGLHLALPWDEIEIYDVRLQQGSRTLNVLMDDGLNVQLEVAWRYRLIAPAAPTMHQYVGKDYDKVLIETDVAQRVRDILAVHRTQELYGPGRAKIQEEIREAVIWNLHHKFNPPDNPDFNAIVLEDVILREIKLPREVLQSIIQKNQAAQRSEEYAFKLDIERKEAERRRIEAMGIRNFQEIVNSNLTDSYLRWRGIDATVSLAQSPNSKVVVIGSGSRGGLPLILNPDSAPASPPVPAGKRR